MITEALIKGLKSVIERSLTSPSAAGRTAPLCIVFMGGVVAITFILAEVFLGLSVYKIIHLETNYGESIALSSVTLLYLVQTLTFSLIIQRRLRKITTQNIVAKEYKAVKGVINALIEGYKSK